MRPRPESATSDAAVAAEFASLCELLSFPLRVRVLLILRRGEQNVTSLVKQLGVSQPNMSHHLGLLREAGLLATRRVGKSIVYSATPRADADELAATSHVSVRLLPAVVKG
jgi:DNA-binding transcriptional ArsR family regulator